MKGHERLRGHGGRSWSQRQSRRLADIKTIRPQQLITDAALPPARTTGEPFSEHLFLGSNGALQIGTTLPSRQYSLVPTGPLTPTHSPQHIQVCPRRALLVSADPQVSDAGSSPPPAFPPRPLLTLLPPCALLLRRRGKRKSLEELSSPLLMH